jgi:hypothetical protein
MNGTQNLEKAMKERILRPAIALLLASAWGASAAAATDLSLPPAALADRIVGLWSTRAEVKPCGTDVPPQVILNTLLINSGGTIIESPRFGPGGVADEAGLYQRGAAYGTWGYDSRNDRYWIHLRFDNYVDNEYHGYSTVDRELRLTRNGMRFRGPVTAARYTADGTLMFQVCGTAENTRL